MKKIIVLFIAILFTYGCTSVGTLGLVTKTTGDPGAVLKNSKNYKELGQVEGEACRFFLLGIVPWGNATMSKAVDNALEKCGGDALINVTVSNSLYGLLPVFYNVFSYTCTEVRGTAVKFEK